LQKSIYDRWIVDPTRKFMSNSSMSGVVLLSAAIISIILTNSPLSEWFQSIWKSEIGIKINNFNHTKDLHYWINDGLMAIFFFVVGLELKREIIAGELSTPRKALLPVMAALGGMIFPAVIYVMFNPPFSETGHGWGIPMATDIAFAVGILYLLGKKVPVSLKVFLTALAIADDLGAVLVIAFFYTSDINITSLLTGAVFMAILIAGNIIGIRSTLFYGLIGIGGLWAAFLMSGVHATIAAVLAAFTIPARVNLKERPFYTRMIKLMDRFKDTEPDDNPTLTDDQHKLVTKIENLTLEASTPLQRLEHSMQAFVAFVIMPIFALSNAGIELNQDMISNIGNPVTIGVSVGLFAGKFLGITGMVALLYLLKISSLPEGTNWYHIIGVGFLAGIGFTMSLFISELAFESKQYVEQAKIGIIATSVVAGTVGYLIIRKATK